MAGTALDAREREEIRVGLEAEESFTDIANGLSRAPSTISREVKRNGGRDGYCAVRAEDRCVSKRKRWRLTKLEANEALCGHVEARLAALDSPTTIAVELAAMGGIDGTTVSAETIYLAVYAEGAKGLCAGLGRHLHNRRRRRKKRCRIGQSSGKASPLGTFKSISARPAIARRRTEPGHFEGDLIIGARGSSAIVTLVDRTSRYNLIGDLPGGHDATSVLACCIELLERVPSALRKTLTWDQGTEMALHHDLEEAIGIEVYFADPHSPWQRPTNEQFNGTLRRYVGKGTDLSIHSQEDLDEISLRLNTMPRRLFNWQSAQDRYDAAVVALTA